MEETQINTVATWDFTQRSDLTLHVEDKSFYTHRYILTRCSPVFRVMLESGNFREKEMDVIELPYKKAEEVQQLLNFVYPFAHQITGTDVNLLIC